VNSTALYIGIGIIAGLIVLAVVIGLLRSSRKPALPPAPQAPQVPVAREAVPADSEIAAAAAADLAVLTATPTEVELEYAHAPAEEVPSVEAVLEVEIPEPAAGRMQRLRSRLARSNSVLGKGLLGLLSRGSLDESTWEEIEEALLAADLGVRPTMDLVERLRTAVQVDPNADVTALLRTELLALVDPTLDRSLRTTVADRPAVVLVVGVNGTGKTTTTGKLARLLIAEDRTVVLGAADTFRAAAADQLQTWGDRVGAAVVRGPEGGDPAAVAYDAVSIGGDAGVDTVVVDTAGRLHTKTGLMDELGKVKRVIEKRSPVDEVLLVLDATTGQNGLVQAKVFAEVVDITGIALTKLDGTAKGGIVVAVQRELGVPVKLVGLGEGPDDLAPFEAEAFVDALLARDL